VLSLTGNQLLAALENGVSDVEGGAGRFPQVAGVRFTFDPVAAPGSRVTAVEVWSPMTETYVELNPDGDYRLATNSYLAGGGDGFSSLAEAQAEYDSYQTGWLLSDSLAEYPDAVSPVSPEEEGRIVEILPSETVD
jgi:5'-nucleotidase/UDP-sugar diphosphatase